MTQKTPHNSPLSLAYAASLLELADEQHQTEQIAQELMALRQVLADNAAFGLYLADPAISQTERGEKLKHIFANQFSKLMMNFLGVLNQENRLGTIVHIADAYDSLLREKQGKIEVDVTVAHKLTSEQLEEVRQKVSTALKKDAVVHQYVDDSIIGGLVLRVQDKLIDASVKSQLASMKHQLLAAHSARPASAGSRS
jgi:F-type H+-transporting ATPase subunit delta